MSTKEQQVRRRWKKYLDKLSNYSEEKKEELLELGKSEIKMQKVV